MECYSFSKVGSYHRALEMPNEDCVASVKTPNGIVVSVICDGAGSKKAGGIAARILAPKILHWMATSFSEQYFSEGETVRRRLVGLVRRTLQEYADTSGVEECELGCTIMVGGVAPDGRCLCLNLGDGWILDQKKDNLDNQAGIVSLPERGIVAQSTYLTSSSELFAHIRYYRWKDTETKKVILLTDGAAENLVNTDQLDECNITAACRFEKNEIFEFLTAQNPQDDYSCSILLIDNGNLM